MQYLATNEVKPQIPNTCSDDVTRYDNPVLYTRSPCGPVDDIYQVESVELYSTLRAPDGSWSRTPQARLGHGNRINMYRFTTMAVRIKGYDFQACFYVRAVNQIT